MRVRVDIEGADELMQALQQLPIAIRNTVCKEAAKSGAQIFANAARVEAPASDEGKKTGPYAHPPWNLRDSIRVQTIRKRPGRVGYIAIAGQKGQGKSEPFYAAMVHNGHYVGARSSNPIIEQGSGIIINKRGKKQRVRFVRREETRIHYVQPNPFMLRAFERCKSQVLNDFMATIRAGIEIQARKRARALARAERK